MKHSPQTVSLTQATKNPKVIKRNFAQRKPKPKVRIQYSKKAEEPDESYDVVIESVEYV